MKDIIYVAAFLLALAGPTVARAHQRNTGWQVGSTAMAAPSASQSSSTTTTTPAEPLLGAPTLVRQFLQPSPSSTSPIPNQLVANPSPLVHSPIVAQAVNKHTIVAVPTVQRYNENNSKYDPNQAPSPTLSGDAGQADQCFPGYDTGGAIFIGPTASQSGAGGTKLECNFPVTIGRGPNPQPNCDISLVDGYSLSLACTGPGSESFGNSENLWTKATCPIVNGDYCTNSQGYAGSQDNVDQFFKNAYPDY